jgi:hypothetical protein
MLLTFENASDEPGGSPEGTNHYPAISISGEPCVPFRIV